VGCPRQRWVWTDRHSCPKSGDPLRFKPWDEVAIGVRREGHNRVAHHRLNLFGVGASLGKPSAACMPERMEVENFATVICFRQEVTLLATGRLLRVVACPVNPRLSSGGQVGSQHVGREIFDQAAKATAGTWRAPAGRNARQRLLEMSIPSRKVCHCLVSSSA